MKEWGHELQVRCKGPTLPAHPQAGQARPVLRPGFGFTPHMMGSWGAEGE